MPNGVSFKQDDIIYGGTEKGYLAISDSDGRTFPTLNIIKVGREILNMVALPTFYSDSTPSSVIIFTTDGAIKRFVINNSSNNMSENLIPEQSQYGLACKDSLINIGSNLYYIGEGGVVYSYSTDTGIKNLSGSYLKFSDNFLNTCKSAYIPMSEELWFYGYDKSTDTELTVYSYHISKEVWTIYRGFNFTQVFQENGDKPSDQVVVLFDKKTRAFSQYKGSFKNEGDASSSYVLSKRWKINGRLTSFILSFVAGKDPVQVLFRVYSNRTKKWKEKTVSITQEKSDMMLRCSPYLVGNEFEVKISGAINLNSYVFAFAPRRRV